MFRYLLILFLFLGFGKSLLADEYKYPRDPNKFIEQFQKEYPNKIHRLHALDSALFEIIHYTFYYLSHEFIKVSTDNMKLLIEETNQKQMLGKYYYYLASYYESFQELDSCMIMMIKANNEFKQTNNYTFMTHSLLALGTFYKFYDDFNRITRPYFHEGYQASLKSEDNFAKAAGAWSMMEYYIGINANPDSIYNYLNLTNMYLQRIPETSYALKNWGIFIKNRILSSWKKI